MKRKRYSVEQIVCRGEAAIETCLQCGGRLRVIASIETPVVIDRILEHLGRDAESVDPAHPSRAPPKSDRLI